MSFETKLAIGCFTVAALIWISTAIPQRIARNRRVALKPPSDACRRSYAFNDPPTRSIP